MKSSTTVNSSALVVGGGVMGLCAATELVRRGVDVVIRDPHDRPGPHCCSWWAGGMLAPDCEGETAEEPVVRLGRESLAWWSAQGVTVEHAGSLVVTLNRDRRELDRFARRTQRHALLDRDGIAALEPHLADRFDRALHFPDEGHLNPRVALAHLRDRLTGRGVTFVNGTSTGDGTTAADGASSSRSSAPSSAPSSDGDRMTVDCRGLSARDALTDMRGVKGEMVVLHCPDIALGRPIRLLHPRYPLYIVPRGDDQFVIGATQIEATERSRATARSVLELLSAAYAVHPAFGEADLVEIGVDARPAFADNLPRIRRRGDKIYLNGLFRHGFLLAPAVARMAAELILDGTIPEFMDEDHR